MIYIDLSSGRASHSISTKHMLAHNIQYAMVPKITLSADNNLEKNYRAIVLLYQQFLIRLLHSLVHIRYNVRYGNITIIIWYIRYYGIYMRSISAFTCMTIYIYDFVAA